MAVSWATPRVLARIVTVAWVSLMESSASAGGGFGDTAAAPRCEMEVELMGVIYNDRQPRRSLAMLAGDGGGRIVRVGSRIAGRPIVAILPQAVWLGPSKAPCWIPLGHEGSQKVDPRPGEKPERKKNPNYKMKDPNYKMKK